MKTIPKLISNLWNLFEIAYAAGWGVITAYLGDNNGSSLITGLTMEKVLFFGGLGAAIIKAIDIPLQKILTDWANSCGAPTSAPNNPSGPIVINSPNSASPAAPVSQPSTLSNT